MRKNYTKYNLINNIFIGIPWYMLDHMEKFCFGTFREAQSLKLKGVLGPHKKGWELLLPIPSKFRVGL